MSCGTVAGQLGTDWVLEVSHMGYLFGLLDALQVPEDARAGLLRKLGQKNAHELRAAALAAGLDEDAADTLCRVLTLCGGYADTLPMPKPCAATTPCGLRWQSCRGWPGRWNRRAVPSGWT